MSLTSQMAIQANADHNKPIVFVRIDYGYPNDPLLAVTAPFSIQLSGTGEADLDGETFVSMDALAISDLKQDVTGAIQEISLSLALTASSPFIQLLDDDLWWNSPAKVWFAYFQSDWTTVVFAPSLRISGFLDKLSISLDGETSMAVGVIRSNRMLIERNRGSRYVASQHQSRHATDRAFSFLPRLASGELLLANDKVAQPNRADYYQRY